MVGKEDEEEEKEENRSISWITQFLLLSNKFHFEFVSLIKWA
jgi:hypothetical protein